MDPYHITELYGSSGNELKAAQLAVQHLRNNVFEEVSDGNSLRNLSWWLGELFDRTPSENERPVVQWIVSTLENYPQFDEVKGNDIAYWYGWLYDHTSSRSREEYQTVERIINLLENNPQFDEVKGNDIAYWYGWLYDHTSSRSREEYQTVERIINLLENNPQFDEVNGNDIDWWRSRF